MTGVQTCALPILGLGFGADQVWVTLIAFAVVGAGPTGVEMAGTMAEIAQQTLGLLAG